MIFGVDVDLTFCPSDLHWWDWMFLRMGVIPEQFPTEISPNMMLEYDLSKEIRDIGYSESRIEKAKPYDYWRQKNLYDDMQPLPGAVDAMDMLHKDGHEILFVSALKGDHHKSKYYFLKKYVPYMAGLIGTKEKHFTRCDVMVDDRVNNLNLFTHLGANRKVLFKTPYKQDGVDYKDYLVVQDWKDFMTKYREGLIC